MALAQAHACQGTEQLAASCLAGERGGSRLYPPPAPRCGANAPTLSLTSVPQPQVHVCLHRGSAVDFVMGDPAQLGETLLGKSPTPIYHQIRQDSGLVQER